MPADLSPLEYKRKAPAEALTAAYGALSAVMGAELPPVAECSHDALQALVTLPAALAPPRLLEGSWREGYILLPEQRSALRPLPVSSPR